MYVHRAVTRVEAKSENYDMFMQLDVNTGIYSICFGDRFEMALARELNLDGTTNTGYYIQEEKKSFTDSYEHVIKGKLYRISEEIEETSNEKKGTSSSNKSARKVVKLYVYYNSYLEQLFLCYARRNVSFGGLLMMLKGNRSYMPRFELDEKLFLLIKKLEA
ncbi:hypothetical protein CRYUN_Cryun01aG0062300 [Craigia yunnanensis]